VTLAAALVGLRHRLLDREIGPPAYVAFPTLVQLLLKAVGGPNPVVLSQGAAQDSQHLQPV
jgi:hypothetical protein